MVKSQHDNSPTGRKDLVQCIRIAGWWPHNRQQRDERVVFGSRSSQWHHALHGREQAFIGWGPMCSVSWLPVKSQQEFMTIIAESDTVAVSFPFNHLAHLKCWTIWQRDNKSDITKISHHPPHYICMTCLWTYGFWGSFVSQSYWTFKHDFSVVISNEIYNRVPDRE